MKTTRQLFLLLIPSVLSIILSGCSDNDNSYAPSLSNYTLTIIDSETQIARSDEPVIITSFGLDDKIAYKRTYVTNNEGEVALDLNQGEYQAEFAFIKGKNIDNFQRFEVRQNATEKVIMKIIDKRDYYECTCTVIDIETGNPRNNEPLLFITLDDDGNEITIKDLVTDMNGKISFKVVAGKYRTRFAYEPGEEPDNTFDFEINAYSEKNVVMNVKSNSFDDRTPIGFVYFKDNFDWIGTEFGGSDYMDGSYPTTEKKFSVINKPELIQKITDSGWSITGSVYARIGYIKYGLGNATTASNGEITTPPLSVATGKYANISVAFKAARFIGKTGALDTENIVNVVIAGDGSFSRTEIIKSVALPITNTAYNEWDNLQTIIYNASSTTTISIGKTEKLSKGRFFLDDVEITKHSKAEFK